LFAALSNRKLEDAGIEMPSWQDAVRRYVRARVAS
jgi:dTDP-4-dehydrorhamnose reductase